MSKKIVIITPHPDDETLGCGGIINLFKKKKYQVTWLVFTHITLEKGFSLEQINVRNSEIQKICGLYDFDSYINLGYETKEMDLIPKSYLINKISEVFDLIKPNFIFTPFFRDTHSDHRIISEAVISSSKWFRRDSIEKIFYYETLSETNFNFDSTYKFFRPNTYFDISDFIEKKINAMKIYRSEIANHPFPRSEKSIRALAILRGSEAGFKYAEAFELLYSREKCL